MQRPQRIVGPGLACTIYPTKLIIEDESHQKVFEGVLATIISGVAGGILLGYLVEHIGFYLFSVFISFLIPIVIGLMGSRKVIVHKGKMKVRRYTRLYMCMQDTQTLSLRNVQQAALRTKVRANGTMLSRVVLELDAGDDFEVTLFLDSFSHETKSTFVDKINTFLEQTRRTSPSLEDEVEEEAEEETEKEDKKEKEDEGEKEKEEEENKERIVDV